MVISQTPLRVSFFGGGTDYPGWIKKHGGQVLSTAIDKYSYVSAWEYKGDKSSPKLNKENLDFENVTPTQRSYK